MKKQGIFRVGASILFMGSCLFHAPANAAGEVAPQEPIEEIEVTGQIPSTRLRLEIQRLQDGMFALFNELNSTDDFDVTCRNSVSRIPFQECEPAYLTKARAANTYDYLTLGVEMKSDAELMFEHRVKTEQLNAEFRELALDHPELAQALLGLDAKQKSLVVREQRLREERGVFGMFRKIDEE